MEVLSFLNENDGSIMVILNAVLISVTTIYVYLTRQMSKASNETVLHMSNEYEDKVRKDEVIKKNLVFLINSEIYMNTIMYVFSLYYLINHKNVNLSDRFRYFMANGVTSIDRASKSHVVGHIKNDSWKQVSVQCTMHFSNELMQELVGYYGGVEQSKVFSVSGMSNDNFITFCKGQLISTFKCLDLLKTEEPDLRFQNRFEIDGKVIKVNPETGDIFEERKGTA